MNTKEQVKNAAERVNITIQNVQSKPRWQLYLVGSVILFIAVYFVWCKLSPKLKSVENFVPATIAEPVEKLQKVPIAVKQVFVFDKLQAGKKLDIPIAEASDRHEQIIDAVDVRPGAKAVGSRVVTFYNSTTGQTHSVVKDIPRSLMSFERGNELGIGYGLSRDGQMYAVRLRRDIARGGSVYLLGEIEGSQSSVRGMEGRVSAWAVYRW